MKALSLLLMLLTAPLALAQDGLARLREIQEKCYTPVQKGMADLVVDVVIPQLTKQLNEQAIFGHLNEVGFRVYWTAKPERIAVEVTGLPEGFREIKEDLKARALMKLEEVVPLPLEKKFEGYVFRLDADKSAVRAVDESGLRVIPEFVVVPDGGLLPTKLIAKRTIGNQVTETVWAKAPWSEPRAHPTRSVTTIQEGPQTATIETTRTWQVIAGIGVPSQVRSVVSQRLQTGSDAEKNLSRQSEELVLFKNYKINQGEAMKWFLAAGSGTP